MNAQLQPPTRLSLRRGSVPRLLPDGAPLTRVSLVHIPRHRVLSLRFGHPVREVVIDDMRSTAIFLPGARFARVRWEAGNAGLTCRQLLVLQACTLHEPMQRIPGIDPGACNLLSVEGPHDVRAVLPKIAAIEALGIDPVDIAPAYWRQLGDCLTARQPLPDYIAARHAAWRSEEG